MASDIIERWKESAQRQLCLPLLPFTHARSESINADSLNSNFLQLERTSGGRPQRAVHPHAVTCQQCDTHYFSTSRPRTRNLPIVGPTRYQQCHRANERTVERTVANFLLCVYSTNFNRLLSRGTVQLQNAPKLPEICRTLRLKQHTSSQTAPLYTTSISFCRVLTGANRDIRRPCQMYLHQAFVRLHLFHKQCLLFKVMKCIK